MDLSLQQKQKLIQRLALTPQMKQALHLLQLPVIELKELVEQQLEENPLLSTDEDSEEVSESEKDAEQEASADESSDMELERIDECVDEYFTANERSQSNVREQIKKYEFMTASITKPVSLQEHLMNQLGMLELNINEKKVGEFILGSIDGSGYISMTPEDIASILVEDEAVVCKMLALVKQFDPPGVCAFDLRECLLLQLESLGVDEDKLAYKIVKNDLKTLGKHRFEVISKKYKVSLNEVKKAIRQICCLDPKPGQKFLETPVNYAVPDVYVKKTDDGFSISLNDGELPELRVNKKYISLIKSKKTADDVKEYLRDRLNAAHWIIRAIGQRQQTLLKITDFIVHHQTDALEKGLARLNPLTIRDIAKGIGMHESTVSRAITNKYIDLPIGLVAFKDLLSRKVDTVDNDGTVSSDEVKGEITEIISNEDPNKPISDAKLASFLKIKGYDIARRTVAKYREELNIKPSHLRKRKFMLS